MKGSYAALMQSKYFNPAFNSAIFDGPVRIYFAQPHEALALKIYFQLQQRHQMELQRAKDLAKNLDRSILVMIYPTAESFENSFDSKNFIQMESLQEDTIIGINGPFEDDKLDQVLATTVEAIEVWEKIPFQSHSQDAML